MRLADGELRVANTGAALTARGVAGLAVCARPPNGTPTTRSVISASGSPLCCPGRGARVVSTTGGVRFDGAATGSRSPTSAPPRWTARCVAVGAGAGAAVALAGRIRTRSRTARGLRHRGAAAAHGIPLLERTSGALATRLPPRICSGRSPTSPRSTCPIASCGVGSTGRADRASTTGGPSAVPDRGPVRAHSRRAADRTGRSRNAAAATGGSPGRCRSTAMTRRR